MSAVRSAAEVLNAAPVPRLLVELPSRPRVFFGNLRDFVVPGHLDPLELQSSPAEFWPDVFVKRGLPWRRFVQSGVYHFTAGALLIGLTHLFALQPRVTQRTTFDHSQVVYYQRSEYLPSLDTRSLAAASAPKADPVFYSQPIISVPPEAANHRQTIVTLPKIKLKQDVAMPNIVAWSGASQNPRLAIPPAPLTPAAEITRLAPKLEEAAVAPPPDLSARRKAALPGLQPELVAPPTNISPSSRSLGELNIASTAVVAPAPQLAVAAQRSIPAGASTAVAAPQVVPPPPSLSSSGPSGTSFGSRGQVIALNVHPTLDAPPDPPAGNRRGSFAATPEGHIGASGAPGSLVGGTVAGAGSGSVQTNKEAAGRSARTENKDLPKGLFVGAAAAKTSPIVVNPAVATPASSPTPEMIASVRPPRATPSRAMQPESSAKLSEAERVVFGSRRFYSVTLNMPNLNSAGGSWVIRFAELNHESDARNADAPAADLSQPVATRKVDPAYPIQLMRENVSGTVILYAVIHADGSVGNVRILRGVDDRLDRYAREAVAQWKFDPATKNGSPVDVEATFQIPFRPARMGITF